MSVIETLKDLYIEELQDLWSANDQMEKIVLDMATAADDGDLGDTLEDNADEIAEHSEMVSKLLANIDAEVAQEHCKGMEGLVKEARKHALDADFGNESLGDHAIIAQYQRMAHYGISGFGTAAAMARSLGYQDHVSKLEAVLDDIYGADRMLSRMATLHIETDEDG